MDSDRWFLALSALLHDVGKLGQRAQARPEQPLAPGYEGFAKKDYGPHGAHATWSAWFVRECVPTQWRDKLQGIFTTTTLWTGPPASSPWRTASRPRNGAMLRRSSRSNSSPFSVALARTLQDPTTCP